MIITKPAITYIGEGETRKPTASRDTKKYKPNDLSFFEAYLATLNLDDAEAEETTDDTDVTTDTEDEDDDLLNLLNDLA